MGQKQEPRGIAIVVVHPHGEHTAHPRPKVDIEASVFRWTCFTAQPPGQLSTVRPDLNLMAS